MYSTKFVVLFYCAKNFYKRAKIGHEIHESNGMLLAMFEFIFHLAEKCASLSYFKIMFISTGSKMSRSS